MEDGDGQARFTVHVLSLFCGKWGYGWGLVGEGVLGVLSQISVYDSISNF